MKLLKMTALTTAMALMVLAFAGCSQGEAESMVKIKVTGMTCNHCVERVTETLQGIEGVDSAHVDLDADMAEVYFKDSMPSNQEMITAIEKAGYKAEFMTEE